jgi:GDP/UDP-N,N'-diacetylbacillosamine 2-epimerase (hydrolysing)
MNKLKSKKKRIAVITTTRADYGLLKNLIKKLEKSRLIESKLIVCGTHTVKKFGLTIDEIKKDKIKIHKIFNLNFKNDQPLEATNFFLNLGKKFNLFFNKFYIDGIIILGDRYEVLSIASVAKIYNIPIIHFHGGESTFSLIDDSIRHAISKLACLHFTSHKIYKKRLENMGEDPKQVFSFGGLGASAINQIKLFSKQELEKILKIKLDKNFLLITFHPITLENENTKKEFKNLLMALKKFKKLILIFTSPNADVNHLVIKRLQNSFIKKNKNAYAFQSLGAKIYYSLMRYSSGIIGNSSSGILEAPSFQVPTINIGNRQGGRLQASSIINCLGIEKQIQVSINKALSVKFKNKIKYSKNLYFQKNTEKNIITVIEKINLELINKKKFYEKN